VRWLCAAFTSTAWGGSRSLCTLTSPPSCRTREQIDRDDRDRSAVVEDSARDHRVVDS
jgi:hypothetical protein